MGVRAAIWRAELWRDPETVLVSSGIPNYLAVAATARFCLQCVPRGIALKSCPCDLPHSLPLHLCHP